MSVHLSIENNLKYEILKSSIYFIMLICNW